MYLPYTIQCYYSTKCHIIMLWHILLYPIRCISPHAVNCSLPEEPSNGTIVDYERLNDTVLEGTVLTYQCDNGLSLTGPNTITCTNAGVWSTDPEAIMCVSPTEGEGNYPEARRRPLVIVVPWLVGLFVWMSSCLSVHFESIHSRGYAAFTAVNTTSY